MRIPLSKSVALSMIIACLLTFTEPGAFISISIALGCTSINICTSVDGCTLPLNTSSLASFYVACAFTNCYSTLLFSSDSSMFIKSTDLAPSLAYTLELQPLLHFHKNSTINVLILYIS